MSNLIGQSLGRYHILEQLGEGGMATVYKAYDTRLERDVAVKIIRRGAFPPDQLDRILKRFEREAKALAKLSHPNIVGVIDYGEHEGSPYLVMEYLPGGTLKQRLGKPVPWQEAVRILIPITEALEYAHEHNIIHRDIKPSNILLTEKGQPMLTDFGIAKILETEDTATLTGTGIGVGTPGYMAPEQWTGQATPQSDIYSLGVVLYEMITGRKPYEADTPAAILLKQVNDPLLRPGILVRNLPDVVERVLLKALANNREDRFKTVGEFGNALKRCEGQDKKTPSLKQPALSNFGKPRNEQVEKLELNFGESRTALNYGETDRPPSRKRLTWIWGIGIFLVILCICGALGFGLLYPDRGIFNSLASPASTTPSSTPALTPTQTVTFTQTFIPTFTPTFMPTALPGMIGTWANEDINTSGITRITIQLQQDQFYIQMWGKCHPTDCYWNDYQGVNYKISDVTQTEMSIIWSFNFVVDNLQIKVLSDGRLIVYVHEHFIDNSGRTDKDFTYYFIKKGN